MKHDLIGPILVVEDEFEAGVTHDFSVAEDDPALQMSESDTEIILSNNMLRDLDVPKVRRKSDCTPLDLMRWLDAVETVMGRGAKSAKEISRLFEIPVTFARDLVQDVKARWAVNVNPSLVNVRREQLYLECERVKDYAWQAIENNSSPATQLKFLQLVLQAGQRQSSLIGAEKVALSIETSVVAAHKSEEDFQQEFVGAADFSVDELKQLGDLIAKRRTEKSK